MEDLPGVERVSEGTMEGKIEAFISSFEKKLKDISESQSEDRWMRGRVSLASGILCNVIPEFRAILTAHRATQNTKET